jgi:hypothetical protein
VTGDFFFETNSAVIAAGLFLFTMGMLKLGVLAGRRDRRTDPRVDSQASAMQAAMLGLLALLLGFTLSLSLAKFNERSVALVAEANAIGTAWLRTDLLSDARRGVAKELMREYGALRVAALTAATVEKVLRADLAVRADEVFARLWTVAAEESQAKPDPAAVAFATSLTSVIDMRGELEAALARHVPQLVLFLLSITVLIVAWMVGYASGTSDIPPRSPIFSLMVLIIVLVFVIIDLDRPRRGFITIDLGPLAVTVAAMDR